MNPYKIGRWLILPFVFFLMAFSVLATKDLYFTVNDIPGLGHEVSTQTITNFSVSNDDSNTCYYPINSFVTKVCMFTETSNIQYNHTIINSSPQSRIYIEESQAISSKNFYIVYYMNDTYTIFDETVYRLVLDSSVAGAFYYSLVFRRNDGTCSYELGGASINASHFCSNYANDNGFFQLGNLQSPLNLDMIERNFTVYNSSYVNTGQMTFSEIIIGVRGQAANAENIELYNWSLNGILQGEISENQLPEVNLSINDREPICFNESLNSIEVSYNVSTYDTEGDTLYYATVEGGITNTTKTTYFSTQWPYQGYQNYDAVYGSMGGVVAYNSYFPDACSMNYTEIFGGLWGYNPVFPYTLDVVPCSVFNYSTSKYCLGMSKACSYQDDTWFYKLEPSTWSRMDYHFNDVSVGDVFNVSMYTSSREEIATLNFNMTSSVIHITNFVNNTAVYLGNVSKMTEFRVMMMDNVNYSDKYDMAVICVLQCDGIAFNWTEVQQSLNRNTDFKVYSGWSQDVGLMTLYKISETGFKSTLQWSTTKPSTVTYYAPGTYLYTVYVTDDVHLNGGTYSYDIYPTQIYPEDYCYVPDSTYIDAGDSIKEVTTQLCQSFDTMQDQSSGFFWSFCNIGYLVLIAIGIIFGIMVAYILSMIAPALTLGGFLLSFSAIMISGQIFIIELTDNLKVLTGILFAVGIISVLITFLGGGDSNG